MKCALVTIAAYLLYAGHANAVQRLSYDTFHTANTVRFVIMITPTTETVNFAAIPDTVTGTLETGSSCNYDTSSSPVALTTGTSLQGEPYLQFEVLIDYSDPDNPVFEATDGTNLGCHFTTTDAAAGKFTFYVRGLASLTGTTATDREYEITSSGTDIVNSLEFGSTSFQLDTYVQIPVDKTTYTFKLEVVDADTQTVQTNMHLGESAQLKFTMTANPHVPKMDISGARLISCEVGKDSLFVTSVTFIGNNGCFRDVTIFDNVPTDVGFSRHSSTGKSGTTKTYIAYSPKFEMSAFTIESIDQANSLYFKCYLLFCVDDSSVTQGTCGGNHCDPARKKRSVQQRPDASIEASVNITRNGGTSKGCSKCTDTKIFQATMGGLGTAVAIVFGVMSLTFITAKTAAISRSERRKKSMYSSSRASSSMASKTVTGSDLKTAK